MSCTNAFFFLTKEKILFSISFVSAIKKEPTFAEIEENFKPPAEKPIIDEPELIPQQPDKPEVSIPAGPVLKIKPLTELLDKKVLKKVKKRKKEEKRSAKKKKKRAKSKERDRESYAVKLSKRATKVSSQVSKDYEICANANFSHSILIKTPSPENRPDGCHLLSLCLPCLLRYGFINK